MYFMTTGRSLRSYNNKNNEQKYLLGTRRVVTLLNILYCLFKLLISKNPLLLRLLRYL